MKKAIYLSIQYMKKQKGRTFALIIGVALAVMLVFSLNVIPETKSNMEIQRAYETFEDFHVEYRDLDKATLDKLKNDKDVTKISNIINLGNVISKNGIVMNLNSYSYDFNKEYGYKIVKGSMPKDKNEIVLEEKALEAMGLSNKLGQIINFNIEKEHKDINNLNQIFTNNNSFKLVGIIKKPDAYYEECTYHQLKAFTYYKEGNVTFIPNELIRYNGVLNLNSKLPSFSKIQTVMYKYGIDKKNFLPNMLLINALDSYNMSKQTTFSKNSKLLPMFASVLLIYNVFNMILVDMTNQIGTLKAIGTSKKHIRIIIGFQSFIVLVLGSLFGFILGAISSYIGLLLMYKDSVHLYISKTSIIEPMSMATITVILASIAPIYKSGKISPIEAIRKSDMSSYKQKDRFYYKLVRKVFGISGEMAYKNVWRNKVRTILSILALSLGGALYIEKMASYNMENGIESTTLDIMSMGDTDISLAHNKVNTDELLVGYENKYIDKIYDIKNIKNISLSTNLYGFLKTESSRLSDKYIDSEGIQTPKGIVESSLWIQGYNENDLKDVENYLEKGSLLNKKEEYINAVVYNNFYYMKEHDNDNEIFKKIDIGDLISIKIPVVRDGKKIYEEYTLKISGILNKDWGKDRQGGYEGNFQVILNEDDFKSITNNNMYNKVSLQIEKDSDKQVHTDLEKILEDKPFKKIESKYNYKMNYISDEKNLKSEVLIVVSLISIISSINIFCTIKTNLLIRTKEFATLRSIGMSIKQIKNMIIKESLIYGITSTFIGGIVGTYEHYKDVSITNKIFNNGFGTNKVINFNIPIIEILQYGTICVVVCIIAVFLSKRKIEKLSISEGLRAND